MAYWLPPFDQFVFDPAWLWFLPILFLVTVASAPQLLFAELRDWRYLCPIAIWCVAQGSLAIYVLDYSPAFAFWVAFAPAGTVLLTQFIPLPGPGDNQHTERRRWVATRVMTALHVLSTMGLVSSFEYAKIHPQVLKTIPGLFGYPLFYVQGFFSEKWWPEHMASKLYRKSTEAEDLYSVADLKPNFRSHQFVMVWELISVLGLFVCLFLGSPVGSWEYDSWPIYSRSFRGGDTLYPVTYVLGTWAWIALAEGFMQAYAEEKVDPWFHHHASSSTIVVYIFHWIFIKVYVWFFIRDLDLMHGNWKYFSTATTFLVGVGGSLTVYAILTKVPALGQLFGL